MSLRIVGIIGKPHGTKGEITVRMFSGYPKTVKKGDILYVGDGKKRLNVESIREKQVKGKKITLIKFAEFSQPHESEQYRGECLYRPGKDSPKLEKNHYWLDDLPGCRVYEGDKFIGTVEQAFDFPANQVLVVAIIDKEIKKTTGNTIMVPFVETYIEQVDTEKRKIILRQLPQYI